MMDDNWDLAPPEAYFRTPVAPKTLDMRSFGQGNMSRCLLSRVVLMIVIFIVVILIHQLI